MEMFVYELKKKRRKKKYFSSNLTQKLLSCIYDNNNQVSLTKNII